MLIKDLSTDVKVNVAKRPSLERIAYEGAITRPRITELYSMFYKHGPGNGLMLSLPFDQLIEHGIGHMLKWERAADTKSVIELANRCDFSALALSIGQAEKYQNLIRPDLPLIVKVDGHFLIGKDVPYPRHSNLSSVERAVEAGANAIGLTFYLGGEETERDAERCSRIVEKAHKFGKPVFAWMYTRGPLPEAMGEDSLYWCSQGISAGESIGADVVKQKFPMPARNFQEYKKNLIEQDKKKGYLFSKMPEVSELLKLEPENGEIDEEMHVKRLSFLAGVAPNTLKIISGGPKAEGEGLLRVLKMIIDAGLEGQIIGRNLWGRPIDEAVPLYNQMIDLMRNPVYARVLNEPRFTGKY